jgi:hypothetical protein
LPAPAPKVARGARVRAALAATTAQTTTPESATPLPDYVQHTLARWRLLMDVPFRYLVPDTKLLPDESIRFFTLDEAWLDLLVAGALATGGGGTREQAAARAALPAARAASRAHRAFVRDVARDRLSLSAVAETAGVDPATIVSGFLLRSNIVSGWAGLQVRAWSTDSATLVPPQIDPGELAARRPDLVVPILRLERLAPNVLVALFAGVPRLVWLEEPHHSVQLGAEVTAGGFSIPARDEAGQETGPSIAVPLRAGPVAGVVDVTALRAALRHAGPLAPDRGSAALALALLQAPSRQRFGATTAPPGGGGPI